MKMLLVSATKFEILPLLKSLKKVSPGYRVGKHSVDVLITGVGMTATAFHLGKTLQARYNLAINAGVAGSFDQKLALGEVVQVVSDQFADMGAEDGDRFLTLKEMGLGKGSSLKSQVPSLKVNSLRHLKKVKGITVNTVHGHTASIKKVMRKFKPDVESMEGAAFFYACNEFKTPAVQLRAISNYVEKRNKKNWKLELAIRNLNLSIESFLNSL